MVVRGIKAVSLLALVSATAVLAAPAGAAPSPVPVPVPVHAPALRTQTHAVKQAPQATRAAMSALESGVLDQLNAIRTQHHLVPLTISAALTAAADQHTGEMAADGYFAHNSQDGTAFWKRIQASYPQTGFHYWAVGENLVWQSPDLDAAGALQLWMASPEHRANILDPKWREIGISALHADAAPGTYQGLGVTIITTDFGVRK